MLAVPARTDSARDISVELRVARNPASDGRKHVWHTMP
jgi:hypothetical protein